MIQRKQTVFLLLALVFSVCCLCLPIGTFEPKGIGTDSSLYNLWIRSDGGLDFSVWPLFAVMLLSCPLAIVAIMLYKNRPLQAKVCLSNMLMMVVWGAIYAFFAYAKSTYGAFHIAFAAAFPIVSFVLYYMAYRGVMADEKLVRAADRIR